jgi:hypothetical protein
MAIERSDFLLFMFKLFNNMYDAYITVSNYIIKLYESLYNTISGINSQWVFLSSYNIPIPFTHINNVNTNDIIWKYNQLDNKLEYNSNTTQKIKIPWLSSKIVAIHNFSSIKSEYSLDNFIESLTINTIPINAPSLYLLITLWSINNKIWFTREYTVQLHIIDEMGDEQIYSLDNVLTSIERNKLIIKTMAPDTTATDTTASDTTASDVNDNKEYSNSFDSESAENIPDTVNIIHSGEQ